MSDSKGLHERIVDVRRFNRFYTSRIGVLHEGIYESAFSLTEARVLYELAHRKDITAAALVRELVLDAGYLSRVLANFQRKGLLVKRRSPHDGRQSLLQLSAKGHKVFAPLDEISKRDVETMLGPLQPSAQRQLVTAMRSIESILAPESAGRSGISCIIRNHHTADMGWVLQRHAQLYADQYGWDHKLETIVAEIIAQFLRNYNSARERCWIAEVDAQPAGSVFLVRKSARIAQLRLLLVEPSVRGHGIGARLINECERFARRVGYSQIELWTNDVLVEARRLYEAAGYKIVKREANKLFGKGLISETWVLNLKT